MKKIFILLLSNVVIKLLQNVKKVKINDTWVEAEIPKKAKIIIDAFNLKKQNVT